MRSDATQAFRAIGRGGRSAARTYDELRSSQVRTTPGRYALAALAVAFLAQACGQPPPPSPALAVSPAPPVLRNSADAADLVCPSPAEPTPPVTPPAVLEGPDLEDLGDLAHFVPEPPPVLDAAAIAGFRLRQNPTAPLRPRRFAIWGDSHFAAGPMPKQLAQILRDSGESVATRFLPPTMGRKNVRLPIRAYCIGQAWTTALAYTQSGTVETGPALVTRSAGADGESYLWLDLRNAERMPQVREARIVYKPDAADAVLKVSLDDGPEEEIRLAGGSGPSALADLKGAPLLSTVKLRVESGRVELLGLILDPAVEPTVTLDVFGVPSAQAAGWANADPAFLAQALHGMSYDGVILEYGTNEANDPRFDRGKYANLLARTLANLRAVLPTASCVLVGPPDRGILVPKEKPVGHKKRHRHRHRRPPDLLRYARVVHEIALTQAEVGARYGCAAWDWQAFMGGPGGSYGWAHANPPLMGADLTHMSPAGYRFTASALAKSLGWSEGTPPR